MPTYYYFDSSAFVKHYHSEDGTDEVERLFTEPDAAYLIARLAVVEVQSALAKKVRQGDLKAEGFNLAYERLQDDVRFQNVLVRPLTEKHYQTGESLIRKHGLSVNLRSLDALQLANALDSRDRGRLNFFVSADKDLCTVATAEQLQVINPAP